MSRRDRPAARRDQAVSAFGGVLMRLCDATGATAAALVDAEGETVDYAGTIDPFEIKVAAAEWRLAFDVLMRCAVPAWSSTHELVVRAGARSYCAIRLSEGYAILVVLPARAFLVSERALTEAVRDLCSEAGLPVPDRGKPEHESWVRVEVRGLAADNRRPEALWIDGGWCPVEILGHFIDRARPREVGYRARLGNGKEVTLVRERLGRWYADENPGRRGQRSA